LSERVPHFIIKKCSDHEKKGKIGALASKEDPTPREIA
jgi:hypothetical protein